MRYVSSALAMALALSCSALAQEPTKDTQHSQHSSSLGYSSVSAAFKALKSRRDVSISVQGGWTIVSDPASQMLWSFTPETHAAHPAVVRRMVVQRGDEIGIDMKGLCEASKAACDRLMAEFEALNAQIRESMKRR